MIPKRTEQTIHSVISNVRTRTKTPSNAVANFESTKIKNPTFLKHCLYQPNSNNGVFKGKVFEQKKRDIITNWKSHQENFDSQTKITLNKTQQ